MSYRFGQVVSTFELLDNIIEVAELDGWVTTNLYNLTYDNESRVGGVTLKGTGDGNDNIYLQLCIDSSQINKIILDSSVGYDEHLQIWEQPGSICQWRQVEDDNDSGLPVFTEKEIPCLSLLDAERMYYFIFSNAHRIIVVVKIGIDYLSMYMGFLNPISSEKQFPYPMYVGANSCIDDANFPNTLTSSFVFPTSGSAYLRRADGVWRAFEAPYSGDIDSTSVGSVFPYFCNNTQLITNYTSVATTDVDFLLVPAIITTSSPVDMCGILRDVYWISGTRDVAAEQIVVLENEQYIIFDSGELRTNNSYFCIKIDEKAYKSE